MSRSPSAGIPTVRILDAEIHSVSRKEFFAAFTDGAVFTPNVDILMLMHRDAELCRLVNSAEFRVCDSQILMWSARFLGTPIAEKLSGSDLLMEFCEYHKHDAGYRVFLLGAGPGVAAEAQKRMNARLGKEVVIAHYCPPMGFENDPLENAKIVQLINASGAGTLAVALGAPKQERWIMAHRHLLPKVRVQLGIGGTLAFYAGVVPRAPRWVSDAGLEWFYRLSQEPKRLWRRYLMDDPPFFRLLLLQKAGLFIGVKQ